MQKTRIDPTTIFVDDENNEIEWVWEKWKPKMLKRQVEYKDYYPLRFGDLDAVFYKEVTRSEDKTVIVCDKSFTQALIDRKIVEKLDDRLSKLEIESNFLRRAVKSQAFKLVEVIEKLAETHELDKVKAYEEAVEEAKQEIEKIERPTSIEEAEKKESEVEKHE